MPGLLAWCVFGYIGGGGLVKLYCEGDVDGWMLLLVGECAKFVPCSARVGGRYGC